MGYPNHTNIKLKPQLSDKKFEYFIKLISLPSFCMTNYINRYTSTIKCPKHHQNLVISQQLQEQHFSMYEKY